MKVAALLAVCLLAILAAADAPSPARELLIAAVALVGSLLGLVMTIISMEES